MLRRLFGVVGYRVGYGMSRYGGVAATTVQEHLNNVRKYMKMQQYVLAELEIRRAEQYQLTRQEKRDMHMIKGEMEIDKLKPDFTKAIESFDAAVDPTCYNVKASLLKIQCLLETNKLPERLQELDSKEQATKLQQNEQVERAYGLYLSNNYEQARQAYNKCIEGGLADCPDLYEHRAVCSLALKDHAQAEKDLFRHHQLVPTNVQTVAYLVSLLWMQGKYTQIVELCEQMLRIDPSEVFAERFKGQCLYMIGDYEGAIQSLNRTIELDDTPESYYYRAMARRKAQQADYLQDLHRMMERQPSNIEMIVEACTLLGDNYIAQGNPTAAREYYKKALDLQPTDVHLTDKLKKAQAQTS